MDAKRRIVLSGPRTGSATRTLAVAGVILWLFLVLLAYYFVHKPFDAANAIAIANTLADLAVAGLMLLLAGALGHRVLRAIEFTDTPEALVIQTGIGLGVMGLAVLVLGWLGALASWVLWLLVLLAFGVLFRDVRGVVQQARAAQLPRSGRGEQLLALFVLLTLGIALVFALAPPIGWDGLLYHLPIGKEALAAGRFGAASDNPAQGYPALVEMLFTAAMGLKGDSAAQVIHWSYLVLTLGAVLMFAARYFTWRVGWLAAALLVAVPSLLAVSTYAYNEAALMFYTLAAFYCTLRAIDRQRARDFVLAGALAGMALGEKYTALVVPVGLCLLCIFQDGLRAPSRRAVRNGLLVGASALGLALPWLIRNWLWLGNPIYPFLIGGLAWDGWRAAWFSRFGTGMQGEPMALLLLPWTVTMNGIENGSFDATIGPLLLALLPLNLLKPAPGSPPAPTRALWALTALLYGVWLVGVAQSRLVWQTRLLFPAFPLLALLAAEGWNRLETLTFTKFSVQRFASLVIALVLGLQALSYGLAFVGSQPYAVLLGVTTRAEYLSRALGPYYTMARWVNAELPPDAHLVALWEPRPYYVERAMDEDAILDRWAHLVAQYGDSARIADEWRRQGVTHVLLFRAGLNETLQSGMDPIGSRELETLQALEANELRLVYGGAELQLVTRDGKPAVLNTDTAPYAVYALR